MQLYQFEKIYSQMEKEFGKIRKGDEETYSMLLLPVESNALKIHRKFPASNSRRMKEAIALVLFDIKSRCTGESFDTGNFRNEDNERLETALLMEALNTDLVCDAINTAMRELFLQIVYGRTQSAFSEEGLPVGAGLEDLGKGLRSQVGTMYGTLKKGPRYLEMAEGYVTGIALDADDEIIGYQFVSLGKMTDFIKKGDDPNTAWEKAKGQYGRVADAVKIIDPRKE